MGRYYIGFCFIEKQRVKLQVSGNPLCSETALTLWKIIIYWAAYYHDAFKFSFFVRFQILNKDLTESFHAITAAHQLHYTAVSPSDAC